MERLLEKRIFFFAQAQMIFWWILYLFVLCDGIGVRANPPLVPLFGEPNIRLSR
jgi:hypothetical protein